MIICHDRISAGFFLHLNHIQLHVTMSLDKISTLFSLHIIKSEISLYRKNITIFLFHMARSVIQDYNMTMGHLSIILMNNSPNWILFQLYYARIERQMIDPSDICGLSLWAYTKWFAPGLNGAKNNLPPESFFTCILRQFS